MKVQSLGNLDDYNQPLKDVYETETKDREKLLVEAFGAEGWEQIQKLGYGPELYESGLTDFFSVKNVTTAVGRSIVQSILQPILKKFRVRKYSLIWYVLTFGISASVVELGAQFLDDENKYDVCKIFAKGAYSGIVDFGLNMGIRGMGKLLGFESANSVPASRRLLINMASIQSEEYLFDMFYGIICGKTPDGKSLEGGSLWEYMSEMSDEFDLDSIF